MPRSRPSRPLGALAVAAVVLAVPALAAAHPAPPVPPPLRWTPCPDPDLPDGTPGTPFECATLTVPLDHATPAGGTIDVPVVRLPARGRKHRIGSLLTNPGGPGASGVEFVRAAPDLFASLNERFDIVGWDPRGTGGAIPVTCLSDAEQEEGFAAAAAFPTPLDRADLIASGVAFDAACRANTGDTLAYVSTENTARDMDALRAALGDRKLTYLGFSYGTYLGTTYASLFPRRVRALVLDGPVDPDEYANDPIASTETQLRGFQDAFSRFMSYCRLECAFGDGRPEAAYRALLAQAAATPLETGIGDGRVVRDYDLLNATILPMYSRQLWPVLAQALDEGARGDGTLLRVIADLATGRLDDGTYDPSNAAFPAISAVDSRWPADLRPYDRTFQRFVRESPLFGGLWWSENYVFPRWTTRANDRYLGPFDAPGTPPILVVGTTHDPATPYVDALALTRRLDNAVLLTMRGDGHTAYGGNSDCIDLRVDRYLTTLRVPDRGTVCTQQIAPPDATAAGSGLSRAVVRTRGRILERWLLHAR